jgi:predicted nucleotidyltransferase
VSRQLELVDALIYADGFDCALTLDEIRRYGPVEIDAGELREELERHPAVAGRDSLYALVDRGHLIDERPARMARARALQRRGRRVARVLRHLPFVRMLALTGSLAADDARGTADVDLMVIAAPGRLATTFLLMGPASSLLRRRLFCPNYYLSEDRLEIEPANRYVAQELAQARCLAGRATGLRRANSWLAEHFPNARPSEPELPGGGIAQRVIKRPLRGRIGDAVERFAARVARSRLVAHYGGNVPKEVADGLSSGAALRFHGHHTDRSIVDRYEARRAQVAAMLAREARPA